MESREALEIGEALHRDGVELDLPRTWCARRRHVGRLLESIDLLREFTGRQWTPLFSYDRYLESVLCAASRT